MTLCTDQPIPIKKGDVMRLKVVYDTKAHPVRKETAGEYAGMPDTMGMVTIIFAKEKSSTS
jgi:hypothetical protein